MRTFREHGTGCIRLVAGTLLDIRLARVHDHER